MTNNNIISLDADLLTQLMILSREEINGTVPLRNIIKATIMISKTNGTMSMNNYNSILKAAGIRLPGPRTDEEVDEIRRRAGL